MQSEVWRCDVVLIIKGALAATLTLVCPHCHKSQLRAKKPIGAVYVCRNCHKHFRRETQRKPQR
jgi:transposase-like protein